MIRTLCRTALTGPRSVVGRSLRSKTDLFGYEVSTNVKPYIEKINKVAYYDETSDILVDMNVANTPPDLDTYNAVLEKIATSQKAATPVDGESRIAASMDLLEEMGRADVDPDGTSWQHIYASCMKDGDAQMALLAATHAQLPTDKIPPVAFPSGQPEDDVLQVKVDVF
eukprot:TRINITY_DN67597_c2_g1_i2.p1 TRINITY_DN67597_c2_g1~~TRINITY_DN67597_c2_g1_i2.p1  ORF type:complete len:169 (-),score=26.17 TRINITY_DN67597_c2_g1_i2:598-1104(-)